MVIRHIDHDPTPTCPPALDRQRIAPTRQSSSGKNLSLPNLPLPVKIFRPVESSLNGTRLVFPYLGRTAARVSKSLLEAAGCLFAAQGDAEAETPLTTFKVCSRIRTLDRVYRRNRQMS